MVSKACTLQQILLLSLILQCITTLGSQTPTNQVPSCPPDGAVDVEIGVVNDSKYTKTGTAGSKIQWRTVTKNNIKASLGETMAAAELRNKDKQYFCRSYQNCTWQPGTLISDLSSSDLTCDLTVEKKPTLKVPIGNEQNVQLLMFSSSTISWVPNDGQSRSVINGGVNELRDPAPLCRYENSTLGYSIIGKYWPDSGYCTYHIDGVYGSSVNIGIEFLAENNNNSGKEILGRSTYRWEFQ